MGWLTLESGAGIDTRRQSATRTSLAYEREPTPADVDRLLGAIATRVEKRSGSAQQVGLQRGLSL
jgi:hypothetical protein